MPSTDPDFAYIQIAVFAGVLIIFLVLLIAGFRCLLPFRFLRRPRALLSERVGPLSLSLCVLWTVALAPDPFLFLWGWLIHFGQALLVDAPMQVVGILPSLALPCANSTIACLTATGNLIGATWSVAIGQAARAMLVPPRSAEAVVVFAMAVTAVAIWRPAVRQTKIAAILGGRGGAIATLALSFMAALYLSIASILAIPIFNETVPDIAPLQADLVAKLRDLTPAEAKFPAVFELDVERKTLSGGIVNAALTTPSKPAVLGLDTIWATQTDAWERTDAVLEQDVDAFPKDAADFEKTAVSFFQVSDQGHVDAASTKRHVTVLVNSYGLWMADYRAGIERCAGSLRSGLGQLRMLRNILIELSETTAPGYSDQLRNILQNNYEAACNNIKPVVRDYLPPRSGPSETLGPFGLASAWLLKTESPELALIVGLLGFGFFGALATSFIREFRGTPGNQLPPIGFILPALIRGIGAAILVFLLAKGGAAIFTKGDATPNAYAIFFACFVSAFFSDDVWLWARNRQRNELGNAGDTDNAQSAPPKQFEAASQIWL